MLALAVDHDMMGNSFSTADLHDAQPDSVEVFDLQFRCFGRRICFHGPIETAKVREDHATVREIVATPGNGRVLLVDGAESLRVALLGDKVAAAALANGWIGVVVIGAIRDSAAIDRLDIGIRALGTTARRSNAGREGQRGVPVEVGGVLCRPGDWLYADLDAVLVSRKQLAMLDCG